MQDFIEQQITTINSKTYSNNEQYVSEVRKALEALQAQMIQEFEKIYPREEKMSDEFADGFNECRSKWAGQMMKTHKQVKCEGCGLYAIWIIKTKKINKLANKQMTIEINEEVESTEEMINLLEEIIRQLKNGNTSGVYPTWELIK